MSAPYYQPQFYYPTSYLHPYYHQPYISPFIPPVTLPGSPNFVPPASLPGSPDFSPRRVHFEDDPLYNPPLRTRRPSWHAGMMGMAPAPNPQPFPSPPMTYTTLPPMMPFGAAPTHHRRSSDGALPQPTWIAYPTYPTFAQPVVYPTQVAPHQFHPLLNGETSKGPLVLFDISLNTFNTRHLSASGQTGGNTLSLDDLGQQATHPAVKRMTITCDDIPQWPIVLEPQVQGRSNYLSVPATSADAPITVGDVLIAVHRSLQQKISHVDWARLSRSEEVDIARAYTRRCKTFPSAEAFEASQGVRRVDYLKDRYMFKGLMRSSSDGRFEHVKLLVGKRR
ncbi:hypothetical protein B0H21DRAFT_216154 [Amylocystis lapponica]|nr:hypothetical protein B0H21DRAFT_216154 [Amylocystis lapponica]